MVHKTRNGRTLARVGSYTFTGAELETALIPNEITQYEPSQFQGSAYLYNGTNITPERIYRFPARRTPWNMPVGQWRCRINGRLCNPAFMFPAPGCAE